MSQTVGAHILERLHGHGIRRVYGYPGDGINGILGGFHEHGEEIEFIQAAHEELAAFMVEEIAERLGAGVAKALNGRDVLPDDLPYVTGSIGLLGTKPSDVMMQGCDTLLMIGSGFPYSSRPSTWPRRWPRATRRRAASSASRSRRRRRSCSTAELLAVAAVERPQQQRERGPARDQRQPEQDDPVGEHGRCRVGRVRAVDDQRPDEPAVDPADAAGQRQRAAELADQVAHRDHGQRDLGAESLERRP
jgi:thiamine pyrophosphate-dependent acetolactate synthase large subunit-like protein